jgi:hypothetical protein
MLPNISDGQVDKAVGEGFLTYVGTGDPVLVAIDVAHNLATAEPVGGGDASPPFASPTPNQSRAKQTYTAKATLLVGQMLMTYL